MKKSALLMVLVFLMVGFLFACNKKKSGICYCSYFSGDKKEYDLRALDRSKQIDSCYVLDGLAEGFAGDCKLK